MTRKTGTRIYRGTQRNVALLANKLQQGELVAVPTETVYGLAANALDPKACRRIFRAKGRPSTDPFIVHIHRLAQLEELAWSNPIALHLAKAYWPGPLTLILPKRAVVPDVVTAGLDSVAVRMPRHPLLRQLLKQCGLPLAAPSANPFGYVSPTTAAHVLAGLRDKIGYILDGGPTSIGLESTIVDVRDPAKIRVLRPGAITAAQLSATLKQPVGTVQIHGHRAQKAQIAPGQLTRHYSPRATVRLRSQLSPSQANASVSADTAYLFFQKPDGKCQPHVYWLDAKGNQARAARRLFAVLRQLDSQGYKTIFAEKAPAGAYAEAINDRLKRAAAKS